LPRSAFSFQQAKQRVPTPHLVWLLMGNRAGDNNQLLALAGALGWPFLEKPIAYNQLRRIPFLRSGLTIVAEKSRTLIKPPWPDLVIGTGYGSVPVARYIREQSDGCAKLIHIGNPRENLDDFDLQITTPQYARRIAPNMLELPFPIGNPAQDARPTRAEREWLSKFPRPRRLVAIGGPARFWELHHDALRQAIDTLQRKAPGGSLIVAVSARTTPSTRQLLHELLSGPTATLVDSFPTFGTLLAESDEIHVTADSVSMLSEAVLSGKPVGMIAIRRSFRGLLNLWLWQRAFGRVSLPDFSNFWNLLHDRGLVGTVELPVASQVCDTVERAANAVRDLPAAGVTVDQGTAEHNAPHLGDPRRKGRRQRSGHRARGSAEAPVRDKAPAL
jgi:mitochondrial fission protein ELM1